MDTAVEQEVQTVAEEEHPALRSENLGGQPCCKGLRLRESYRFKGSPVHGELHVLRV